MNFSKIYQTLVNYPSRDGTYRNGTYPSIYPSLVNLTSAYPQKTLGTLATLPFLMPSRGTGMQDPKEVS